MACGSGVVAGNSLTAKISLTFLDFFQERNGQKLDMSFKSFQDDERVIMTDFMQWNTVYGSKDFAFSWSLTQNH